MSSGKNRPLSTIAVATSSSTLLPVLPMPLMAAAELGLSPPASTSSRLALALNAASARLLAGDGHPEVAIMPFLSVAVELKYLRARGGEKGLLSSAETVQTAKD